jgi:hypothetical protein
MAQRLYMPKGLYTLLFQDLAVQGKGKKLQDQLEAICAKPESRHPRVPKRARLWFSIRHAIASPGGAIVAAKVPAETPGAICISQDTTGILTCEGFDIRLLDLFDNCDLLKRGEDFLEKCIMAFKIKPAARNKKGGKSADNMRPTNELSDIWNGKTEYHPWPTADQLRSEGFDEEMIHRIVERGQVIVVQRSGTMSPQPVDLPLLDEIIREFRMDEPTTNLIFWEVENRKYAERYHFEKGELVNLDHDVKFKLARTCFTNGRDLATYRDKTGTKFNFGGRVVAEIPKLVERHFDSTHEPDAPWLKTGPVLVAALQLFVNANSDKSAKTLLDDRRFENEVIKHVHHLKACSGYCLAKLDHLESNYHKISQALSPEKLNNDRVIMAYMRALDCKAVGTDIEFDSELERLIAQHHEESYSWQPRHPYDRCVLREASERIDPETGEWLARANIKGKRTEAPWPAIDLEVATALQAFTGINIQNGMDLEKAISELWFPFDRYYSCKLRYLRHQYWKIERVLAGKPTNAEEITRFIVAFLRAVDCKVVNQELDFDGVFKFALSVEIVQPLHGFDQYVLDQALESIDHHTGKWKRERQKQLPDRDATGPHDALRDEEEPNNER